MKNPSAVISGLRERLAKFQQLTLKPSEKHERPMLCVCRTRFRGFSTWFPHWKRRHPRLYARYSAGKDKARVNLMLKMLRDGTRRSPARRSP